MNKVIEIIEAEPFRLLVLQTVAKLNLPDCYVAAGFVRNMVWDYLHNVPFSKPNDIDVLYYDANDFKEEIGGEAEIELRKQLPQYNWDVKNQALMHLKNGDKQYFDTLDAMRFWPEIETAIGVRLNNNCKLEVVAAFGFESLFNLNITHNPNRSIETFKQRFTAKNWLKQWPKLKVIF